MSSQTVVTATRRIAIQGIRGAFHEIAAKKFFGEAIELETCYSFPELFLLLDTDKADFGVVAIENSVAGTILPNYALLRNSTNTILGEVYLRIEHCLMALPNQSIQDIKEVHSHPMAIQQCQAYFEQYPHIRLVESADTAASAEWIQRKQRKGIAAIASKLAAEQYDLEILDSGIETNKRNFTRFLVIGDTEQNSTKEWKSHNPNKASLCFNLGHQVGCLSQVLLVLSSHGMNLTKIQSLPIVGKEWEYFFHIDLAFDAYEQYRRSLDAIQHLVNELKILGEYSKAAIVNPTI